MAIETLTPTRRDMNRGRDDFYGLLGRILAIRQESRGQEAPEAHDGDPADFYRMASELESCLLRNLMSSNDDRREGFIRSLAAYLDFVQEYGEPNLERWDAIESTEWSCAKAKREAERCIKDQAK